MFRISLAAVAAVVLVGASLAPDDAFARRGGGGGYRGGGGFYGGAVGVRGGAVGVRGGRYAVAGRGYAGRGYYGRPIARTAVRRGVYGAAAEVFPEVTAGAGLPYGAVVWLGADEGVVPLLGLSKAPNEYPVSTHAYALASHLVYGLTTEIVRRGVRNIL